MKLWELECRNSFKTVQSFVNWLLYISKAVQTGEDSILGAVELGRSMFLVGQRVFDLEEVVFNLHNKGGGCKEIIGERTNLCMGLFSGFVLEVGETRLEEINL